MITCYSVPYSQPYLSQTHSIKLPDHTYIVVVNNFHTAATSAEAEAAVRKALSASFDDTVAISTNIIAPKSASLRFDTRNQEEVNEIVAALNKVKLTSWCAIFPK